MTSSKKAMTTPTLNTLVLGDVHIPYTLIRKRKRHLSFRFSNANLVVSAPMHSSRAAIENGLKSKANWIIKHYTKNLAQKLPDDQLLVLGKVVTVEHRLGDHFSTALEAATLIITHRSSQTEKAALTQALTRMAETTISSIFQEASRIAGVAPKKMEFKNMRSSLGRCSSLKTIILARRLIHYPPEVIEAVCYHELAHLTHMNHSQRFYAQLEGWLPKYRQIMKNARNFPSVSTID